MNNVRCQIDRQILQYAVYSKKAELFIVNNTSFIFTMNILMRVLADTQVLYYDIQDQVLSLKL